MLKAGTVLGNRYVVERILGQGGMGVVVAAKHRELGQRVAIKMIQASGREDPEVLSRFERESRAVAELASEHVARVTDVGTFDDGSPFMVMEYLEGEDLAARIYREGLLDLGEVLRLFIQACIGLGDAHEHGIVHRDVKPSNLFLTKRRSGRTVLKVLDFGIAKSDDEHVAHSLTRTNTLIGSPQYMSPEQLCDPRAVDRRTDIWSLGASFYEAITGVVAFPAESLPELHMKVLAFEPAPPASIRTDCFIDLDVIVRRCLEKNAENRFSDMAELQAALEQVASAHATHSTQSTTGSRFDSSPGMNSDFQSAVRGGMSLPPPPSSAWRGDSQASYQKRNSLAPEVAAPVHEGRASHEVLSTTAHSGHVAPRTLETPAEPLRTYREPPRVTTMVLAMLGSTITSVFITVALLRSPWFMDSSRTESGRAKLPAAIETAAAAAAVEPITTNPPVPNDSGSKSTASAVIVDTTTLRDVPAEAKSVPSQTKATIREEPRDRLKPKHVRRKGVVPAAP